MRIEKNRDPIDVCGIVAISTERQQMDCGLILKGRFNIGLVLIVLGFVCVFSFLSVSRYRGYNVTMYDIGNMAQAIWNTGQGRPLEFTLNGKNVSRLAGHVELFYYFLVPLYAVFPTPVTLLVFQSCLFGLGAFALYDLAMLASCQVV